MPQVNSRMHQIHANKIKFEPKKHLKKKDNMIRKIQLNFVQMHRGKIKNPFRCTKDPNPMIHQRRTPNSRERAQKGKTIRCKRLPKAANPAPSNPLLSPSQQQPTKQNKKKIKTKIQSTNNKNEIKKLTKTDKKSNPTNQNKNSNNKNEIRKQRIKDYKSKRKKKNQNKQTNNNKKFF